MICSYLLPRRIRGVSHHGEDKTNISKLLNLRDLNYRTPIAVACNNGAYESLKLLLENHKLENVPVMSRDRNRDTPLTLACSRGYLESPKETAVPPPRSKTKMPRSRNRRRWHYNGQLWR